MIYKKYYGTRMMLFIFGSFYLTMALAGYIVELLFSGLGLVPTDRHAKVTEMAIHWNYTERLEHRRAGGCRVALLPLCPHGCLAHAQDDGRSARGS